MLYRHRRRHDSPDVTGFDDNSSMPLSEDAFAGGPPAPDELELIIDSAHLDCVVARLLRARVSVDIATADFKAMLIPSAGFGRSRAPSIVTHLRRLAQRGVEVRILHAGVPSSAAREELRRGLPDRLRIRRCPRLHAKAVIVDASAMYLGSANLTGAGLGAKAAHRRNFEWGIWTSRFDLLDAVLQQYNNLWEGHRCEGCGRRDVCPVPLEEPQLVQPAAGEN
jgi:phosphatidylserine/phosphatidylglycerophosphate/cardiolipin synthase-like enzyme